MKKIIKRLSNLPEKNKNVFKNVVGAFIVKGLALVVSLLTMPAYMSLFNDEIVIGLWFTILSVLSWVLNFDLGIGNGLRNKLTETLTANNQNDSRKYLSSAYISIGILCVLVCSCFMIFSSNIDWNAVFNIRRDIISQVALTRTVQIVFLGIILQLFFKLITSVLYALQKSFVNNLLSLITSIFTLICVLVIPPKSNEENIIWMAIIHVVAVILPLLVASLILFTNDTLKKCFPSFRFFSFSHAKEILTLGGKFFFVQLTYMAIMSTNEYLITYLCGNQYVTEYQIYYKIFVFGSTIFSLAMTPIWSAVTKAFAQNDINWIIKLNKVLTKLSLVGASIILLLIPFLQFLINIWLKDKAITVNYGYAFTFAILGGVMIINSYLSSIENGLGILKPQATYFGIGAMIKIPIAWILVHYTTSWIGVVWANIIAMGIYCFVRPWTLNKKLIQLKREV